jgi:hypothetical protein
MDAKYGACKMAVFNIAITVPEWWLAGVPETNSFFCRCQINIYKILKIFKNIETYQESTSNQCTV